LPRQKSLTKIRSLLRKLVTKEIEDFRGFENFVFKPFKKSNQKLGKIFAFCSDFKAKNLSDIKFAESKFMAFHTLKGPRFSFLHDPSNEKWKLIILFF